MRLKRAIKKAAYGTLPLEVRKRLAVWIDRQSWLPGRHDFSMALIRDWSKQDVSAYHKFLWAEHLGYAKFYDAANSFGNENVLPSRRLLFDDLLACLKKQGIDAALDVKSVFEVGCSQGFLLRYAETELFPAATKLAGIDIDATAVEKGCCHLRGLGSRIQLQCCDMSELENVLDGEIYDVMVCAGVLLYVTEAEAQEIVGTMLRHVRGVVAIAGLGHPERDNATLDSSEERRWDAGVIHNVDALVAKAGGRVLQRRWEGARRLDGQRLYFVFAAGR